MSSLLIRALMAGTVIASTGCFRMTIVNQNYVAEDMPRKEDAWRSATVLDVFAIDSPMSLDGICKDSKWARIEQVHSVIDWFVDVVLAGWVYESTHVNLYCTRTTPITAPAGQPVPAAQAPVPADAPAR
jgi:hypothetical protein